jgi:hypothetical protein
VVCSEVTQEMFSEQRHVQYPLPPNVEVISEQSDSGSHISYKFDNSDFVLCTYKMYVLKSNCEPEADLT